MDRDKARHLRDEGFTLQEIGAHLGVSRQSVHHVLGNTGRGSRTKYIAIAVRVCKQCGKTFDTPASRLREKGRTTQFCNRTCYESSRKTYDIDTIVQLRRNGLSQTSIAKQVGISQTLVSKVLSEIGPTY